MDHLTQEQRSRLQQKLEEERDRLLRREEQHREQQTTVETPDVGDQQDAAAVEAAQVAEHSLHDRDRARLREVQEALQRIADGSYGICEDTDDEIPFARLWAEPTARLTVAAQELREREVRDVVDLRQAY
jgi:DnaK suppressor protein